MAAVSVSQIIKEALGEIKNRQLMLTPENYAEIYNEISKKYGFSTEESRKIEKYISRLNGEYKNQAMGLNIKTVDEFVAFAIARLTTRASATNTSASDGAAVKSINAFARRVLQASSMLHNKEVRNLAEQSMQLLAKKHDEAALDAMREKWFAFIAEYNSEFLEFLRYYGGRSFDDLPTLAKEVENFLSSKEADAGIAAMVELLISALEPSITKELDSELAELKSTIKQNPASLNDQAFSEKIKSFVGRRIEEDKAEIKQRLGSLNGILETIGAKISNLAASTNTSSVKMQHIQSDLKDINLTANSVEQVKEMLLEIATALEIETRELGTQMTNNKTTIAELQNRVMTLEKQVEAAKLESKEDFLTKTATKRALMDEIARIEETYKRYGVEYSLCFIDIDYFKKINDTYGHDAGDTILAAVAALLKKYARKTDFVGRYGGEEFIVLLPNTALKDGVKFADKLRSMIENFKFIYKNERIKVTISAGVASRSANLGDIATMDSADKMLYAAKQGGRNQVMPKIIE